MALMTVENLGRRLHQPCGLHQCYPGLPPPPLVAVVALSIVSTTTAAPCHPMPRLRHPRQCGSVSRSRSLGLLTGGDDGLSPARLLPTPPVVRRAPHRRTGTALTPPPPREFPENFRRGLAAGRLRRLGREARLSRPPRRSLGLGNQRVDTTAGLQGHLGLSRGAFPARYTPRP